LNEVVVSNNRHARQAALALLKMAKTTSDPNIAAGLIEAAADLKDQAGELPPSVPERKGAIEFPRIEAAEVKPLSLRPGE
jgi:hypothetical protein